MKPMHRLAAFLTKTFGFEPNAGKALQGRLVFIDALRGLAAITIALHHIDRYEPLASANTLLPPWLLAAFKEGRLAVQFFFVISGFMIARSLVRTVLTPATMARFSFRRLIRLGIPYWTILAIVLALDLLLPWVDMLPLNYDFTSEQITSQLFFLQDIFEYGSTSTGLWFICIEVQFFLLFVVLSFVAQKVRLGNELSTPQTGWFARLAVFLPMALVSLFLFNVNDEYDAWVVYFFGTMFLGAMTYWALNGSIPRWAFWLYVVAVAGRLAICPTLQLTAALVAMLLVYTVGCLGGLSRWLSVGWLQYLGKISYSLFLVHYTISHVVKCLTHRFLGESPAIAFGCMGTALLVSIAVAHFFYRYIETPAFRLAEQLKDTSLELPEMATVPALRQEELG